MGKASRNKGNKKRQFYKNPNISEVENGLTKEILYGVLVIDDISHLAG